MDSILKDILMNEWMDKIARNTVNNVNSQKYTFVFVGFHSKYREKKLKGMYTIKCIILAVGPLRGGGGGPS